LHVPSLSVVYAHLNMEAEEGDGADDDIIQLSRSAESQKK
jgi:hypothetical protein